MPRPRRPKLAPAGKATTTTTTATVGMYFPVEPLMALDPAALERLTQAFFFFDDDEEDEDDCEPSPVRTICIDGHLVYRESWWWCSYEDLAHELQEAFDDPTCEAIVLRINSPGGLASGMTETVRRMREAKARAGKPVLAYVDELAASAAYGLATLADEIWLPPSGTVGSVGTMLTVCDETKANALLGLRVEVLASGVQKTDGHPDVPLTSAAMGRMRERMMTLNSLFVAQVADARRMTPEAVLALEAGVFLGQRAIEVGLADRLGGLEDTLAEAARRGAAAAQARSPSAPRFPTAPGSSAPQPKENDMKLLLAKLGLPETASEAEALSALAIHTDVQRELLSLTGATSSAGALGAVRGWKDGSDQAAKLKAQLEGVQKAKDDTERATLCSQLRDKGYTKAQVEKLSESMSLDGLRGYASVATVQAHTGEKREPIEGDSSTVSLTAEERESCAQLGVSEEVFLKEKKLLANSRKGK